MNSSRAAPAFLALLFAMLWIPAGQHAFLLPHWMKVGAFVAPFLLYAAIVHRRANEPVADDLRALSILLLVAYIAHQCEEHWIDLYGQRYAFYGAINEMLVARLDLAPGDTPLSPAGIFVINTSLVWLVGGIAIWRSPRHAFPALAMAAITLVNAIAHIAMGIATLAYNPGLLTSIVLFVPLSLFVYRRALVLGATDRRGIAVSLLWAALAHVLMVAGMIAANVHGLFPEVVYFALLIAWSIVPSVRSGASRASD